MQVAELRKRAECLPDSYLVVLVGDMITEEALPTYMAMLNTLDGARDETGAAPTPWGRCALSRQPGCKLSRASCKQAVLASICSIRLVSLFTSSCCG